MRHASLRLWQHLSVQMAVAFLCVTVFAVGLATMLLFYGLQDVPILGRLDTLQNVVGVHRHLEEVVSVNLLNLTREGVLGIDPAVHAEAQRTPGQVSEASQRIRAALVAIRRAGVLTTAVYTLADYDPTTRQARVIVVSDDDVYLQPGRVIAISPEAAEILGWTFEDGFARTTPMYEKWNARRQQSERWLTAFAPINDSTGNTQAVMAVEHQEALFAYWFEALSMVLVVACIVGGLVATMVGVGFAWHVTRPVRVLTGGVRLVANGDLSPVLPVRSHDELGQLTQAFNEMVEGLRQRDFIRTTFGRYVSPEVVQTLLASPEGLRFGGAKRTITVLMSELRGYTQFAEQGDPELVMACLNDYLARMTDIIIAYGGTINEFIGDAIFAVYGAPAMYSDHAERAAASALAMQQAMAAMNQVNTESNRPRFEMGIGLNTGEAVVGNIGSEQRAKYAVVGAAVNLAARIEGCTVGGQIFLSPSTYAAIQAVADVAPPVLVELKGIAEPMPMYELRGITGQFAQRLPESEAALEAHRDLALPVTCWVIEGKVISQEALPGTVLRLSRQQLAIRMAASLQPLTNVRLRLRYPELHHDSGDLYGKVLATEPQEGGSIAQIRLTSMDSEDQKMLAAFLSE